jgi:hypothetical protein
VGVLLPFPDVSDLNDCDCRYPAPQRVVERPKAPVLGESLLSGYEIVYGVERHAIRVADVGQWVRFCPLRLLGSEHADMLQAYPAVYKPRAKLSDNAQRAGWQGFIYDLSELPQIASLQVYPSS